MRGLVTKGMVAGTDDPCTQRVREVVEATSISFVAQCYRNEPGGGLDHNNYASFLGLRREQVLPMVQQAEPLTMENLVGDVQGCKYLFLDPDTGIPAGAIRV